MNFFIRLSIVFLGSISISQSLNAEEKKDCSEYKKLSKEYLSCTTKKITKSINKNLKIDGKSPSEVKDEVKNY